MKSPNTDKSIAKEARTFKAGRNRKIPGYAHAIGDVVIAQPSSSRAQGLLLGVIQDIDLNERDPSYFILVSGSSHSSLDKFVGHLACAYEIGHGYGWGNFRIVGINKDAFDKAVDVRLRRQK